MLIRPRWISNQVFTSQKGWEKEEETRVKSHFWEKQGVCSKWLVTHQQLFHEYTKHRWCNTQGLRHFRCHPIKSTIEIYFLQIWVIMLREVEQIASNAGSEWEGEAHILCGPSSHSCILISWPFPSNLRGYHCSRNIVLRTTTKTKVLKSSKWFWKIPKTQSWSHSIIVLDGDRSKQLWQGALIRFAAPRSLIW